MKKRIKMFILSFIFNERQLCILCSVLSQAIEKYTELYADSRSGHYMNQRTSRNIADMIWLHDFLSDMLIAMEVNPEEVD
jgi:hypothetical protein